MSDADREIQERARRFVDEELIPHEVEAEMHGGRLSDDVREKHHRMAIELGLWAMNMPKELGGGGLSMFQQVLVSEQIGRVTNALGWCVHTPAAWAPAVVIGGAARTVDPPDDPRRAPRVLRDHRGGRGLRRRRDRGDRAAGRRRVRAQRHEDARDLVQLGRLRLLPGQDRRWPERRLPRDVLRRQGHARGSSGSRARVHAHVRGHARGRRVRGRPRARRRT